MITVLLLFASGWKDNNVVSFEICALGKLSGSKSKKSSIFFKVHGKLNLSSVIAPTNKW